MMIYIGLLSCFCAVAPMVFSRSTQLAADEAAAAAAKQAAAGTAAAPVTSPVTPASLPAETIANPSTFFAGISIVKTLQAATTLSDLRRAQRKLHDQVDKKKNDALDQYDAEYKTTTPSGNQKPSTLFKRYQDALAAQSDAQTKAAAKMTAYQQARTTYLAGPGKGSDFSLLEKASINDSSKRGAFMVALKTAKLDDEWNDMNASNKALTAAQGEVNTKFSLMSPALQSFFHLYSSMSQSIDSQEAIQEAKLRQAATK